MVVPPYFSSYHYRQLSASQGYNSPIELISDRLPPDKANFWV